MENILNSLNTKMHCMPPLREKNLEDRTFLLPEKPPTNWQSTTETGSGITANYPVIIFAFYNIVFGKKVIEDLGMILMHEHLSADFSNLYYKPPRKLATYFEKEINLKNFGFVRQFPHCNKHNLILNDQPATEALLEELKLFYSHNGATIMENTTYGYGHRDLGSLKKLSEQTGVNIVLGTGYYKANTQIGPILGMKEEEIYDVMLKELLVGYKKAPEKVKMKAGFIGELGCSWPLHEFEKKCLKAAAQIQEQYGYSVTLSIDENHDPIGTLAEFQEAGGNDRKVAVCHADRLTKDSSKFLHFADMSYCYLSFDFGINNICQQYKSNLHPVIDVQRIGYLKQLKKTKVKVRPAIERVLLSQNIHTKNMLRAFGGLGYSHILTSIVPQMEAVGFNKDDIEIIIYENPQRWLK